MQIEVVGEVLRRGISKKSNQPYVQVACSNSDGQKDVIIVMTPKEYKPGTQVKMKANAFIRVCSEIA